MTLEGPAKKDSKAKTWSARVGAIVTAAVAAYAAVKPESKANDAAAKASAAQVQVARSYDTLAAEVKKLQSWVKSNRARVKAAAAACEADVDALKSYTAGFLLGQGARVRRAGKIDSSAVQSLVKALRARAKAARPPPAPALRKLPSWRKLKKGAR